MKSTGIKKLLKNNLFMLKYIVKYTPDFLFWVVIEGIIWGFIHSVTNVIFIKILFDKLEQNAPFSEIALIIAIMAAFSISTYIFNCWFWNYYEPQARQRLHRKMQTELFEKARSLDLACYDNPKFFNDFVWAIQEADGRAISVAEDMGKLINRIISTVTIIGVLLTVDPFVVLSIIASVAITVRIKMWRIKISFNRDLELKPLQRKNDYIGRVFYLSDYAKEMRLSKVDRLLHMEFDETIKIRKNLNIKFGKKLTIINTLNNLTMIIFCETGINILLLYKLMVSSVISLGDFAASNNAVWQLYWQINNLIDYVSKFPEHSLYAEKFKTFLEYEPKIKDGNNPVAVFKGLNLKNVSFSYEGNNELSLKNVSLEIKMGEKIALVGYNGAGKSTLIKLIMRLYDPVDGTVEMNGVNIKEYTIKDYRDKIGAVFQDYQIFAMTIAENVLTDNYSDDKKESILSALKFSSFNDKLESLPIGLQTPLTREFDKNGVNLSGGEAQKIAIARVFVKPFDLIILDEPTSALDPMSEYALNQSISEYAKDKTVIFISHRLSTTRMADKIYMLEKGEIIEEGNHDELMSLNGKYAYMFNLQAEKYRTEQKVMVI
ncbi:MAG: transporter related [Clostridia bacterium]|nr:transporter related [Clostridia bacterium]